jgi:minor extracellular protease Epr
MRRGGGRRAQPSLVLRCAIGLSLLAVPITLGGLARDSDSWIGSIGRHVLPPAEARKSSGGGASMRGAVVRPPVGAFKAPVFQRSPQEVAVRPPASPVKVPVFAPPKPARVARLPDANMVPAPKPRRERRALRPWAKGWGKGRPDAVRDGLPAISVAPAWRTAVVPKGPINAPGFAGGPFAGRSDAVKPRATFHRMRNKLSRQDRPKSKEAKSKEEASGDRLQKGDSTGADARGAKRRLGSRPVPGALPPIGSFRPNEVLAINLGPDGLAKARAGSYTATGTMELPEFGLTVTRLRPPDSLNAVSGWDRLYELLPEGSFALNRVYTPYRLGSGPGGGGGSVGVAQGNGRGCTADRCFGTQLINWQAPLAACARDIKVGVIDTGFDAGHPAFAGLRYEYREFLPGGGTRVSNQHGTGILSLLAGNAGSGTPGLIPDAHYVVANVFFADADGEPVSDTVQMLQALHWLKQKGVAVANLSFAGPEDELMHHGVQQLTKAGIVVVAAAGNDGPSAPPSYPAAYSEVIAVTAVDRNLAAYRYAGRGHHIDVAAPGVDVWTALPGRREGPQTGTSFAVPYVTAVIAVAHSGAGLQPSDDPRAAKTRALAELNKGVKNLGERGRDPTYGAGLVQAPPLCERVAPAAVAAANPWAGSVHRAVDQAAKEPLVLGAWISTVRVGPGDGRSH